jgi:septal ring factor EnvC (AmiA/AmiB activator)
MSRRPPHPLRLTAVVLMTAVAACALGAPAPSGAQDTGDLESRADRARSREGSLAADVARLGRIVARLEGDLAVVQRRRAEVQAELDADQARLDAVRARLREQRRRAVRLRARLHEARTVLAGRMVELYKTPRPDVVTVVMKARGFSDLLDQATYVGFVGRQDARIIHLVRAARRDAAGAIRTLGRQEARQQEVTEAVAARRAALAGISASLAGRQAAAADARAARAAALSATRADRQALEKRIAAIEAARAREARVSGPGGPWAIPWPIVQCESGGQNVPPNHAGASGYYQILPSTWKLYGGSGPAAWKASKAEQDRVAAKIWAGGSGASQWVCAGLVG